MVEHKFSRCKSCGLDGLVEYISFGQNPISTNYRPVASNTLTTYTLSIAVCDRCDLAQLHDHIPEAKLVDPPTWIRYNEPELHLDAVVSELILLIGNNSTRVRGLSYKDLSTIERLERRGYKDSRVFDFNLNGRYEAPINIQRLQKL